MTSGGHVVILRDYITGEESRQIRAIYIRAGTGAQKDTAAAIFEGDNKSIELTVLTVDGLSDNIVDRALKLPVGDFVEVIASITEIVEGKKKSETPSQAT